MELGLSLGDASKSLRFIEKAPVITKKTTLEFCMGLSLANSNTHGAEENHIDKSTNVPKEDIEKPSMRNNIEKLSSASPPLQLGLIRSHVTHSHSNNILLASSENGSSDGGSSGHNHMTRRVDINRMPLAENNKEDMVAASYPNSASYNHIDLCIYDGGNKRDSETNGNEFSEAERTTSRASDEDEHCNTRKKLRLSKEQSAFLEEKFKEHSTLNPKQKLALAKQLGLRPRQVEVWFQNRRARTKLKQTEVDYEYLKRCCVTLTEENRRLHKELQELRALKTSNPNYTQLPAIITMCPSCERVATTSISSSACFPNTSFDPTSSRTASIPQMLPNFSQLNSSHQHAASP